MLNVVPTSNARSTHGVDYTVAFTLDDRLLSHRFDLGKGGK